MEGSRRLLVFLLLTALTGCQAPAPREAPVQPRGFELGDLAKGDIDMVAEVNVRHSLRYLRELARKLYVRNPDQFRLAGLDSPEAAVARLFGPRRPVRLHGLHGVRAADAIHLAFNRDYRGDRIAALIEGMRRMLLDAYGGKDRFYVHDRFDPQKLYHLARNFEIAFWKLRNDRDADGDLYLLSNSLAGSGDLSFERLAGKLIGLQDHMAQVVAESSNRQIKNVIQSVASAVFFPI